jgi:hypothetical protein
MESESPNIEQSAFSPEAETNKSKETTSVLKDTTTNADPVSKSSSKVTTEKAAVTKDSEGNEMKFADEEDEVISN